MCLMREEECLLKYNPSRLGSVYCAGNAELEILFCLRHFISYHLSMEAANMSPRFVAIDDVGFWVELTVRKISGTYFLFFFPWLSSAYAEMS